MKRIRFKKESQILKITTNRREHKILTTCDSDPYPDDSFWSWHRTSKSRGAKRANRELVEYQVRMYKTWKHNRKTQWK